MPGLDLATLSERGIDIGGWPKKSEAVLTPFMRLLLESSGEDVVSAVAGLNLLDLSKASDQQLARVARLAWAVKRLFNQLETTNPAAARVLAGDDSPKPIDPVQIAALTGGMSHDVIVAGSREWFPDLQDDLQRHDRGEPTRDFKPPSEPTFGKTIAALGRRRRERHRLRPRRLAPHRPTTSSLLETTPAAKRMISSLPEITPAPKTMTSLPLEATSVPRTRMTFSPRATRMQSSPQTKRMTFFRGTSRAPNNILSGSGETVLGGDGTKKVDTNKGADAKKSARATPALFDPEVWAQTGGWYREDFTIRYRPTGHADPFLQSWLDYAGRAYGTSLHDQFTPIFDELAPQDAVGRCTKCHSVDDEAGAKIVNWMPFDANAIDNRFTNYSHKPHIELVGTKSCIKCHELWRTENQFMKTYEGGDPVNYKPNFKQLDKSVCATCHSTQASWENCTLCHGYHVGDVKPSSPVPPLPVSFDRPTAPAADAATAPLDLDVGARHDYAMAEDVGTKQAWDNFIANHPSGPYHDMAVQQIAKLSPAAPDISATVTPENPTRVTPDKSTTITPESPTPVTPDKSATVTPDTSTSVTSDKSAIATPDNSAFPAPAKSASADTGEPTDLDGVFQRGLQRAVRGNLELAIQDFNEVIRRDPRHAGALNNRCWVLAMLDEVQAALKDCDASLRRYAKFS